MRTDIHHYELCSHCDLLIELPSVEHGHKAVCPRCHKVLLKSRHHMKGRTTIYAASALMMLFFSCGFQLIDIRLVGNLNGIGLLDIPLILYSDSYSYLSLLFILFVLAFPLFNLIVIILLCSKFPLSKYLKRDLLIVYGKLKPWCMPEIFLIGILVSIIKLVNYGELNVTNAFWAFSLFVVFYLKALTNFSTVMLWNELGTNLYAQNTLLVGKTGMSQALRSCNCCKALMPANYKYCPRCKQKGQLRERDKVQWMLALLTTSLIIYIPSNLFGIMITAMFDSSSSSTIIDGVIYMWQSGDIPVALVIFIASIIIPILKIVSLSCLCHFVLSNKNKNKNSCRNMNSLYNMIELIGKWSMIDVFVVAVVCSLVRNQQIMGVYPDIGIVFFATVVIITIFVSKKFDPRLIWDRMPT